MADVRSLLRQERASRQQTTARAQRQSAAPAAAPISKKRKAVDDSAEDRKRTRTEEEKGVPAGFFDSGNAKAEAEEEPLAHAALDEPTPDVQEPRKLSTEMAHRPPPQLSAADMAEMDAFLDEMQKEPAVQTQIPAFAAGAVIESAPMTAAEIAAQAREEMSAQRARQDEEVEAEKEDAARQLEDEFEEMEGLEERVKKLREKREALRAQGKVETSVLPEPEPMVEDVEESESDDEDWDDWRFRPA
ncbi:hypothetical protein B0J11DRAFT_69503 [Dendryphion nanum]|uniref:Uncharacterized protein n=1 Tax=Dendryphion nanum TaxID=256645 RepID=A0A9P9IH19_9PLEO|nr:hypothetical protein B0J11DRAFT_69503 [Dendryphion nanum]